MSSIREMIQDAGKLVSTGTPEQVAASALALAAIGDQIQAALEPLKTRLREEVADTWNGGELPYTHEFPVTDGQVKVTIPRKTVKLAKSADTESLIALLGADQFSAYFETVVTHKPRKNFPDLIESRVASTGVRDLLLKSIEYRDPTPRVSFKSTLGG